VGPAAGAHDQRRHSSHARGLLHVRRLPRERQRAHGALARRSDRGWRPAPGPRGPWTIPEARRARRGVEVRRAAADIRESSLYNEDLAPVPQSRRDWGVYNYASLWVGMSV